MARVRTVDFLPEIFQTSTNRQFLSSTLDQLVQEPKYKQTQGYVGRKIGPGINPTDAKYVVEPDAERANYQLEPAVVMKVPDTDTVDDAITYPGITAGLSIKGANTTKSDRLYSNQYYAWDPFVDYDKMVNFSEYYWLPTGPLSVSVTGGIIAAQNTIDVTRNPGYYTFSGTDGQNPILTLVRGGSYQFRVAQNKKNTLNLRVTNQGNKAYIINYQINPAITLIRGNTYIFTLSIDGNFPFWIKTIASTGTVNVYSNGVTNNGINQGTLTFTVPQDAPDTLYYSSQTSSQMQGTFNVVDGEPGTGPGFYIQAQPGIGGYMPNTPNISSRDVLGVSNNGEDLGTITFNVPSKTAQNFYYTLTSISNVDLLSDIKFNEINNAYVDDFFAKYPTGIDGVTDLNGRSLAFNIPSLEGQGFDVDTSIAGGWLRTTFYSPNQVVDPLGAYNAEPYDLETAIISLNDRYSIWQIQYQTDEDGRQYMTLSIKNQVNDFEKFQITFGTKWSSTQWYRSDNHYFEQIPLLTAVLDTLYYQDSLDPTLVGEIRLIDSDVDTTLFIEDILGKKQYTSPNNVVFTNGLIVQFRGSVVPTSYANNEYFVEGVGEAIVLVPVVDMVTPETYTESASVAFDVTPYDIGNYDVSNNVPLFPDYITINRASPDRNAWSRSNRWFHRQVLEASATYNNSIPLLDLAARARRPILEFNPGLKLFDFGSAAKTPINIIDFTIKDAFSDVNGVLNNYIIDGYTLVNGSKVIFAADEDPAVRNKIYEVQLITPDTIAPLIQEPIINLVEVTNGTAAYNDVVVCMDGATRQGQSFWFDGVTWQLAQQKFSINQPPLFDVFVDDASLADPIKYPSSTFAGSKLFSYAINSAGVTDPVLGIALKYLTLTNVGDIVFDNNFYTDTFIYVDNRVSTTQDVSIGFVRQYFDRTTFKRKLGWTTAPYKSKTYQQFQFTYTGEPLLLDVKVDEQVIDPAVPATYPVLKVYVGSKFQDPTTYDYTTTENTTTVNLISGTYVAGDIVIVLALSSQPSAVAFYQVPSNLENNALNQNPDIVTLGTVRTHYESICQNLINITGTINGSNNSRDLGYIAPYGLNILQQSSPITLLGYFLRDTNYEFFTALEYNASEYIKFKYQLLDIVAAADWGTKTVPQIFTEAISILTAGRTESSPFYWSDMLPARTVYSENTYTYTPISTNTFNTIRVYDFNSSNYYGLLVYVNNRLLVKDYEYVVSTDAAIVTITATLNVGDVIAIQEFDTTVGNYVPNTPTKMGLYPSFRPGVYLDETYVEPTTVIRGHDGSITATFGDIRDSILLEFETRVYNNLKVQSKIPIKVTDIIPGQFRTTDYTLAEVNGILSADFLTWVATNKIDYAAQEYISTNPYTYNYSQSSNKLTGQPLLGAWRGIYNYFYDTYNPAQAPWEMLGFTAQPDWWESRYGLPPYTSGNMVLWDDLSLGRVADPAGSYILPEYARPELIQVLPVDEQGNLVPPLDSVVGLYSPTTFQRSWKFGDDGPVENAWRTSSSYPFAIMRLMALTKPAEFFSLFADRDLYKYDAELNQYLYNKRYRIDANNIQIYGQGTSKASFINWIVDYNTYLGNTQTPTTLASNLKTIGVQLAYRMASFSDKKYIKMYIEKPSPNSVNTSLLLPDDGYDLFLYKNQPFGEILYSSIIVQKVNDGYSIFGYGVQRPYFEILISQPAGLKETIYAGGKSATVPVTYTNDIVQVPYGYVFSNETAVCDFILSYGELLSRRGMIFDDIENGLTLSWRQMAQEFLYWSAQGWGSGSIVNLNPTARTLMVTRPEAVVDNIVDRGAATIIQDQNRRRIYVQDLVVDRFENTFKIVSQNEQTINSIDLKFTAYEHILVLKNVSVFGDLIYDPITAARQGRLLMIAATTDEWNGQLDAQGFILNQNNIEEWSPNVKYTRGQIVLFKNVYYSAADIVQPKAEFDFNDWLISDYNRIQKGLLPNISNKANQIRQSYDIVTANLERDQDLLSYGLIGFRPRDYMTALNLGDASQVNVYQQFLGTKGTKYSIDLFGNANFENVAADYVVYENWAVLKGTYGAQANRSFFDVRLNQALLTSNPSTVQVIVPFEFSQADQTVFIDDLWRESYKITSPNILPTVDLNSVTDINLPSAGYVNLNDVDITVFDIDNSANINANLGLIGVGTYIWIAKINNHDWGVFRCEHIPGYIAEVADNLDGTSIVTFSSQHNLAVNDTIIIKFFDTAINGVYKVITVPSINTVTIAYQFVNQTATTVIGKGVGLILQSSRVAQASDAKNLPFINTLAAGSLIWVDEDANSKWLVLEKTEPWNYSQFILPTRTANAYWSEAIAQTYNNTIVLSSAPYISTGIIYQYALNSLNLFAEGSTLSLNASAVGSYGASLVIGQNTYGAAGAPTSYGLIGYTAILTYNGELQAFENTQLLIAMDQPGPADFGRSVAMSSDERWLYVGAPGSNAVYAYGQVPLPIQVVTYTTDGQTLRYSTAGIQYDSVDQLDVYIENRPQRLGIDYSATLSYIQFNALTGPNQTVYIYRRQLVQLDFYQYLAVPPGAVTGVGEGATFNIDVTRGVYSATVANPGFNFSVGEIITIYGSQIGGSTPTDNCYITVDDVTFAGGITEFTVTGSHPSVQDRFPLRQYLYTAQNINSFTVRVNGTIQRPKIDYEWELSDSSLPDSTLNDYDLVFVNSPPAGAEIFVTSQTYYAYTGKLTVSGLASDAKFGFSVATNSDGSEIIVGCPYEAVDGTSRAGTAYVFNRNSQKFNVTSDLVTNPTFTVNGSLNFPTAVRVNGAYLYNTAQWGTAITNTFTINYVGNPWTSSSVTINQPLNLGEVVEIETNIFTQIDKITSNTVGENAYFGNAVAYGLYDCSAIVGAPGAQINNPRQGLVDIAVNQSRLYGTISSTLHPSTFTAGYTININGYEVAVPDSPDNTPVGLVNAINSSNIPNTIAAVSASTGLITIDLINKQAATPYQKLFVEPGAIGTGSNSVYNLLGFSPYQYIETLTSPYVTDGSQFGSSITTEGLELIIGAPYGTPHIIDTFDGGDTVFDAGSTAFYSDIPRSGVVYQFDYLPAANESMINPGAYVYGQQIYYSESQSNYLFGASISYTGASLIVGAPGTPFDTTVNNNGSMTVFWNYDQKPAWSIRHLEQPSVNIYALNSVTLYDRLQSAKTTFLDFFDPLQGKILGAARQNIDFITAFDPAGYNTGNFNNQGNSWGASRVGQMWWDTTSVRFVEPGQDDIVYASRRWGQIFPGSQVDIYQWIESTVPPANYTGTGTPYSILSYSVGSTINASGAFVTSYYFWVRGITTVNTAANKTLSAEAVGRYIEAPIASGIPFMAPITSSCFALYNCDSYLSAYDTIVHIEFDRQINDDNIHTEFQLLAQGRAGSFLTPALYRKLQDSFCGVDSQGSAVPDTNLSPAERYGVQFRPRQSMFTNRFTALENYINRTNNIISLYPIAESRTLTLLNSEDPIPTPAGNYNEVVANLEELSWQNIVIVPVGYKYLVLNDSNNNGRWTIYEVQADALGIHYLVLTKVQSYVTSEYWSYIDWYSPGFNRTTAPSVQVASYAELITLVVPAGTVGRVISNSQGKWELYQLDSTGWQRVGLQDGTIEISSGIWNYAAGKLGFDGEVFDAQYFDQTPQIETRKIIQSINEELLIDDLLIERNSLLTLMFNYILTEQLAPQWLLKTSLIDVEHTIRELLPYPIYRRDNQDFVLDYLNEVKPYHVQIREFNLRYNGFDDFAGDITDFDVPAYYDAALSPPQYVSPILANTITGPSDRLSNDIIWQTTPWDQWYANYTLYVEQIVITNGGSGYTSIPTVNIIGTAARAATAVARIDSAGTVIEIVIVDAGTGYINTPTVTITGGNGTGARAAIYMTNGLVRSITTTIKFDRCEYNTNIVEWEPNITFDNGQLVRFGDKIWAANSPDSTGVNTPTFDPVDWVLVPIGDLSGVDRTMGYYVAGVNQPGRELPLLIDGVDYPGVQVAGVPFEYDTGYDHGPFDVTPWDNIDFGSEGRPTYSDTILNAQYESSFLDIYLGTRASDVNVDGGAFVDTYSSYAPQELVPGQEFDTLDLRVYTRPGSDWSGFGFGFLILQLRAEYNPVDPVIDWSNIGKSLHYLEIFPSAIELSNATQGRDLVPDVDFTVDWVNRTVLVYNNVAPNDIIVITVYQVGGGNQLLQANYNGADVGVDLEIDVAYSEVYELVMFVNGELLIEGTDFTYAQGINPATTIIHFNVILTNNDAITLTAMGYETPQHSWSLPVTQYIVVPDIITFAAQLTFPLDNSMMGSNIDNAWVEVNGRTVRPSQGIQWFGDGSSAEFLMPDRGGYSQGLIADNEVHVYVNDVAQVLGSDFVVVPWDGFSPRTILLSYVPAIGDTVLVCVNTRADYVIAYNGTDYEITFRPSGSFGLQPGDIISVTTWNDTSEQNIVQRVWVGPVSVGGIDYESYDEYPFDFGTIPSAPGSYDYSEGITISYNDFNLLRGNQNPYRMIVTWNGQRLFNGLDYTILQDNFTSFIELSFTIGPLDVVVATLFTGSTVPPAMAFRIFQDMRGVQATYRILPTTTTTLREFLAYDDDIVQVANASACGAPNLSQNAWGVVTIGGERIMYRYRDVENNTLSGLLRGTAGTAAADHQVNDDVISMGRESILEQGYEDKFVGTDTVANGSDVVFEAPNVNITNIDSTEYTEALRVFIGGVPVPSTQYILNSPNPVRITFYEPPKQGVIVTIGVLRSLSWYNPGPDTPSDGIPLQQQINPAALFLRGAV